jgi:hypothetical protein
LLAGGDLQAVQAADKIIGKEGTTVLQEATIGQANLQQRKTST